MKSTFAGILTIGISVLLLAWIIPVNQVPPFTWVFIFFILVACSLFAWAHPKAPIYPLGWASLALVVPLVGLLIVLLDYLCLGASSALIPIDIAGTIGSEIVTVAGLVRSLTSAGQNQRAIE